METKLKSVFRNPQSALAFKAVVFAAFFFLAKLGGFSTASIALFLVSATVLYLRPIFRTFESVGTFAVLLASAIIFCRTFIDPIDFLFAVIYFPLLLYILVGIKDLILIRREAWKAFLNFALAYPALLIFFYYNQGSFWWKLPLLFAVLLFLSKDFLKTRIVFWLVAFLSIQVVWAADLLPIGFVSAANLSMLFYAATVSFCDQYLRNALGKKFILTLLSVFVLLLMAILAFSRWGI